jgi:GAF domain-containing protein
LAEAQRLAREEAETAGRQAASALRDAVAAQRSYVEGAWEQYATSVRGYVYTAAGLRPVDGAEVPGTDSAIEQGQIVVETTEGGDQSLTVPLSLYGEEIIGTLGFVRDDGIPWTPGQLRMVENVAEQVARALETKRLLLDVQRRAARLTAAAEVSSATTSMTDVDQLLAGAVDLIRDRFGLYYVGIFLVDENDRWAVLVAATGEAGRVMIERGHKLAVEATSMIGLCIVSGVAQIASDVDAEETRFDNPLLPDTRSELALPLTSRGEVIGAMTIQHEMPGAFVGEDITTLQTMADQLANAIQNARLLEQMERSVRELRLATGAYTEFSWRDFVQGRRGQLGYRYRLIDVSPAGEPRPEAAQALEAGSTVAAPLSEDQAQLSSGGDVSSAGTAKAGVGVPIRLRDQVLGVLNLRFEDDYVPPETVQMIEQVADRLAISLESARLLEETQRTAQRERLISEVSQRIRQSLEVDEVLRSSVSEIRGLMDLFKVSVRLAPQSEDSALVGSELGGSKSNGGEDAQDTGA